MQYGQFAYYYDRLMADTPYFQWLDFARKCWERYGGAPETVADVGCGTGNISIPLAREGMKVYGIDLSEHMLAVARSKAEGTRFGKPAAGAAAEIGEETRRTAVRGQGELIWLQQDLRDWQLAEPVDAVVSFCDCINYLLEPEQVAQSFRQAYRNLRQDGTFLFDVHPPQQLTSYAEAQPFFLNEEDIAYIWTCEFDEDRCELEHHLTIFHQASAEFAGAGEAGLFRRFEEYHVQRAYPLDWLERQLKLVGFRYVEVSADFRFEPPTEHSQRVFFAAVK